MTQGEDKKLLFIDLSARLPYHVRLKIWLKDGTTEEGFLDLEHNYADVLRDAFYYNKIIDIKPYLRPLSSMTEEEILELYKITYDTWYSDSLYYKNEEWINFRDSIKNNNLCFKTCIWLSDINKVIDWLNARHFDYHGLISKGLALEAPEGMYK